jgi:hypothetical protein
MTGLTDERCPTCHQKMPSPPAPKSRRCFLCQQVLGRHDKWEYMELEIEGKAATVVRHRHCDNPEWYKPKEAA